MMQSTTNTTVAAIVERIGAEPLYGMKKLEIEIRAMVEVATQERKAQLNKEIDAYRNNFMEALNGDTFNEEAGNRSLEFSGLMSKLTTFANGIAIYCEVATEDVKESFNGDFDEMPYIQRGITDKEEMKKIRLEEALDAFSNVYRGFMRKHDGFMVEWDNLMLKFN
jgi:hypothetical protein